MSLALLANRSTVNKFLTSIFSAMPFPFRINGDPKSIIDVEDQEIQVDYEQFARMLLGAAL